MRSVVVFQWKGELPNDREDDPERLTTELSRPAAEALLAELKGRGYATNVDTPYCGEGGWHFNVDIDDQTYSVFTMWTGIGKPDENYFSVQPLLNRGCLASLFIRRQSDYRLEPVCCVLDESLKAMPLITRLQWLTSHEFQRVYFDGEPLPQNDAGPVGKP